HQYSGRVGLRDCQFRLVDRNRTCRHADLGDPAVAPAEMAQFHQPLRRGDDDFRRHVRWTLPAAASRAPVVFLLAFPISEYDGYPAAVQESAGVGRLRGFHVFHGLPAVLVRGPHSRPRHAARPRAQALSALRLRHAGDGLARLATPLVVSVHTVVSFDFTIGLVPGWHSTIFPPYFVAGAIYSGFAMVLTLAIPLRKMYGLEDFITLRHLKNMGEVMLATGLIVAYGYMMEGFVSWYSGSPFERYLMFYRMHGAYR